MGNISITHVEDRETEATQGGLEWERFFQRACELARQEALEHFRGVDV